MAGVPGYRGPEAGFFLWLPVDDGEAAALKLWREAGVRVLPGHYLSRDGDGTPGKDRIRVATGCGKRRDAPRPDAPAADDLRVRMKQDGLSDPTA
jgi:aspartate/methionine/tyrosine aminotransferase